VCSLRASKDGTNVPEFSGLVKSLVRQPEYVRANSAVKGRLNMTTMDFCKWVNKTLLPNSTLEPGFPRKISVETAWKWLHKMGFEVLQARKGIFNNGHERPDVVASHKEFLRRMVKIRRVSAFYECSNRGCTKGPS